MLTLSASILPAWLVVPVCCLTMLAIGAHVVAIQRPDVPPRRRRLRTAAGLMMMLITALMGYALGIAPGGAGGQGGQARVFILIWMAVVVLLGFVVALAAVDAFYTARLAIDDRKRLRRELGLRLSEDLRASESAERSTARDE